MTILAACKEAGICEAGWYKAMQRPGVMDVYERTELAFIQTVERRRAQYKARAIEVAAELMERGKSEQVRMRAVEFFAGEAKSGAQVQVNVNVDRGGYEYVRPGQRVVDIVPVRDSASDDDQAQPIDMIDVSPEVDE